MLKIYITIIPSIAVAHHFDIQLQRAFHLVSMQ